MIADHRRNLGRVGKIETLPILQICPRPSQTIGDIYDFEFSLVGKIWDSRETVKSPIIWDFPDCPRFCQQIKTRNRRYPQSSGMDGDNSGESGVFLFSRRVPDFCVGRRPFPTNENSNLYRRGRRRWVSLITNPLNCWAPVPLSKINMASLETRKWWSSLYGSWKTGIWNRRLARYLNVTTNRSAGDIGSRLLHAFFWM